MTETRSVVVRLSMEASNYIRNAQTAGKVGEDAMQRVQRSATSADQALDKSGRTAGKASTALDELGINAGTVALAVGTGVVMASANFEKAMSGVQAATHESTAGLDALRDAALEAGASTSFSATEAAAGIENLAKAGLSTQDILAGGLSGSLDLAAAGGMDVASAAEAAAGALAQFKLEGDQATHVADLLAAGAGKAQGDVSDMVMALKQAGTVSAQTGLSLEETVAALSAMAEQSLLGSDAGTSFKTMLAALTPNSKKAADAMERYNIHAFDAQGNFVGMTELAGQLQAGLSGLTDEQRAMALETIFGSDAVRAASIIYDNGAEGIANWTAKVDDAGYAAETAAIQMDNLKGDVEQLKGALETAFIEGGDDSQGMLRGLTQAATDAVNLATETEKADGALGGLWDSAMGAVNPLGSLGAAYNGLKGEISGTDEKAKELDGTTKSLTETTGGGVGSTSALASATEGLGGAFDDTAAAMEAAEQAAEDFQDLMDSLNAVLGGRADLRDYEAAIDDFTKKLKENGNTFDTNTEKGRENEAMLDDIAGSALAVAENMGQADRRKFLTAAIKDLRTMGQEMGLPKGQIRDLIALLREAHNADVNPKIDVDTTQSLAKIQSVRNSLENLRDRNLTITTTYKVVRSAADAIPYRGEADGGVLDFYANGGMRENHVAQIAPAGAWRVWAEPETGGEAYIPLASSKRERSIDIWEEVGQRLGVNFMEFAEGGTTGDEENASRRRRRRVGAIPAETGALIDRFGSLTRAIKRSEEAVEKESSRRDALRDRLAGVEQQMADIADAATAGFSGDPFRDRQGAPRGSVGQSAGGSDPIAALMEDIAYGQRRDGLLKDVQRAGLGGSTPAEQAALAEALKSANNDALAAMLASGTVQQYEDLHIQRQALIASHGEDSAQAVHGAEFQALSLETVEQTAELREVKAELRALRQEARARENREANRARDNAESTGAAVTEGVNSTASAATRHNRRKRRPRAGAR